MHEIDMRAADTLPPRGDELLRVFARFEYALKDAGFGRAGRRDVVEVAWNTFANEGLTSHFMEKVIAEGIAPTLLTRPPSHQVLKGGALEWQEAVPPATVQDLLGAVCRVRNNLVHGGKHGDEDADRNEALVAEALAVLMEALHANEDVRYRFENRW
jgi:hypothetical protein